MKRNIIYHVEPDLSSILEYLKVSISGHAIKPGFQSYFPLIDWLIDLLAAPPVEDYDQKPGKLCKMATECMNGLSSENFNQPRKVYLTYFLEKLPPVKGQ